MIETLSTLVPRLPFFEVNPRPKGRGHLEGASSPLPKAGLNNPALKDRVFFHWINSEKLKKAFTQSPTTEKLCKFSRYVFEELALLDLQNHRFLITGTLFKSAEKMLGATAILWDLRYWIAKWEDCLNNPSNAELLFFQRGEFPSLNLIGTLFYQISHLIKTILFASSNRFQWGLSIEKTLQIRGSSLEQLKIGIDLIGSSIFLLDCFHRLANAYENENGSGENGISLLKKALSIKNALHQYISTKGERPQLSKAEVAAFSINLLWISSGIANICFPATVRPGYYALTTICDIWAALIWDEAASLQKRQKIQSIIEFLNKIPADRHIPERVVRPYL